MWHTVRYMQFLMYDFKLHDIYIDIYWYMRYDLMCSYHCLLHTNDVRGDVSRLPTSPPILSLSRKGGPNNAARHLAVWALIAGRQVMDHESLFGDLPMGKNFWGIWVAPARWKSSSFSSNHGNDARLEWRLDFDIFWYKIVTVLYKDQSQNLCKFARFNYVYLIEWHVHCTLHHT